MTPHTEAPAVIVLRLTDPEREAISGVMQRLREAWGRQVEPFMAVRAMLGSVGTLVFPGVAGRP